MIGLEYSGMQRPQIVPRVLVSDTALQGTPQYSGRWTLSEAGFKLFRRQRTLTHREIEFADPISVIQNFY